MKHEQIKKLNRFLCKNVPCRESAVWIIVRMDDVELPLCDNCRRAFRMGMANHDKIRLEEKL